MTYNVLKDSLVFVLLFFVNAESNALPNLQLNTTSSVEVGYGCTDHTLDDRNQKVDCPQ